MRASRLGYQISHTGFSIAFPVSLYVVCNSLIIDRLSHWFQRGDGVDYAALSAYLIAGACLLIVVFTLFAHRPTIKPVAILLILSSAAATYFIGKYGVAIDSSMVRNVMHTDATEAGQLLSFNMVPYILFLIILPVTVVFLARITFLPGARYLLGSLKLAIMAFCLALACIGAEYNAIFRAGNASNKYIVYMLVPINVISGSYSVASKAIEPFFKKSEEDVVVDARVTAPGNLVVVLAVGEASRRKNFSVYGYSGNPTNPELEKISGLHLLEGIATQGSTLYALPRILTKDGIKLATVVSKAGIPTACLVNYTLYESCAAVGEVKAVDCGHGGRCFDEDVIPLLEKNLGSHASGYRFVVLHFGGGSHGPNYDERVPPEFRRFKPTCDDADIAAKCSLEQVYNSYDNTILYVDHVLGKAIDALERSGVPYVFIYLSDHGESLMENGAMFHGMPPGMALPDEQVQIPLIVKSSVPVSIEKRARYDQPDVFDSVLDLFSIQSDKFDKAGSFIKVEHQTPTPATPASPVP